MFHDRISQGEFPDAPQAQSRELVFCRSKRAVPSDKG